MQTKSILVSVIIPLYKGKKYVSDLVEQIERNSCMLKCDDHYAKIELIFVNDYPQEKIVLEQIKGGSISCIQCISLAYNLGVHGARVEGLKYSKGKYILFLDQDDYIEDCYLQRQLEYIQDNDAVLCNGWYRNRRIIYQNDEKQRNAASKDGYLRNNTIVSPGQVLLKKDSIPTVWEEHVLKHNGTDDVLLWISMLSNGARFAINSQCVYTHRENGTNNSFHWKEMIESRNEMLSVLQENHILDKEDMNVYCATHNSVVNKYQMYLNLDKLLEQISNNTFSKLPYKTIAIYGMGVYGVKLYKALQDAGVQVMYGIDRDAKAIQWDDINVFMLNDDLPIVDAIIVSAVFGFKDIKRALVQKVNCPILRMDEIF